MVCASDEQFGPHAQKEQKSLTPDTFFGTKYAKNAFVAGALPPRPCWEFTALPGHLVGFRGPLSGGKEGKGREGREGNGEGKERAVKEKEGKGK